MSDGDWDWYNYSLVVLETSQSQYRDFKCTCLVAVHFNVWCAIGNMIHVVHSHLLKKEVNYQRRLDMITCAQNVGILSHIRLYKVTI